MEKKETGLKVQCFIVSCLLLLVHTVHAQVKDSTLSRAPGDTGKHVHKRWVNNIFQQAWNSIQKSPGDTSAENNVLNTRSEDQYKSMAGRTIRHIYLSQYGFDRNFIDTSRRITSFASRVAQALHVNTKEWVVRNNLFIKEQQQIDPYIVADNERYLRTLDFLQDARILVEPVEGEDSVDILVVTKDLFSIKADLDNNGISSAKVRLRENNFLGMGQQLGFGMRYDPERDPAFGYDAQYSKNNIAGTFIHGTVAFSNTNAGHNLGLEDEESYYLRLDRPLPSPYFRVAGGLEASVSHSLNLRKETDSLFNYYRYNNLDVWLGYNLFLNDILRGDENNRERKFLSMRYFRQRFTDLPRRYQNTYDYIYNSKEAILGQLTFFKQDFIKTQYIYGFGITEDVPYGYNISLTGGWWQQLDLRRPYTGANIAYYTAKPEGAFCQYYLRTGAFYNNGSLQDASILAGLSYFSKLYFTGNLKIRQYVRATFTQLFNRVTYEPLRIDNSFGLRDFGSDSLYGTQRASIQTETSIFTHFNFQGFKFAPFIYADVAMLRGSDLPLNKADIYTGIGGGIRSRSDNLILGTIEVKAIWFPRTVAGSTGFKIQISSDVRYRYNTNYVTAPDIARLNYDW